MSTPINLNRARKDRARAEKRAAADANAAKHGRPKAEKQREAAERARSEEKLDQHRRDPS